MELKKNVIEVWRNEEIGKRQTLSTAGEGGSNTKKNKTTDRIQPN